MSSSAGARRKHRLSIGAEAAPKVAGSGVNSKRRKTKSDTTQVTTKATDGVWGRAGFLAPELLVHIFEFMVLYGSEQSLLSVVRVNKAWFHTAVRILWRKPPLRPSTWQDFFYILRRGGSAVNFGASSESPQRSRRILRSVPCPIVYGSYIRTLNLSEICDFVTDRFMRSVAESCSNLRIVNVERCQRATAAGIGSVVSQCRALEQMDLTGISASNDAALLQMFPVLRSNIKNIALTLSPEVTGPGLIAALENLPNLERLWLQHCDMLRDETISKLLKTCLQLTDLSLLDCRQCTNVTVEYIAHNVGPRLSQLTIGLSDHIRDPSIQMLATHCRNLTGLTLALLRHITDESLISIAKYLPNLNELGIFSSPHITNTGVARVATSCRKLERLCLYDCQALTPEALVPVEMCLDKLDYLNIEHCHIREATPEIRNLWKRCKEFLAGKDLLNALHIADMMYYSEGIFGVRSPVQLAFEIV
ncbi:hypothetical protein DFS34DRAFT_595001 [Phlyctochytrium arcticum]|nr:hypothetical protein DFS34DRAFT_595001 [Phlyctochytrium arcticum]